MRLLPSDPDIETLVKRIGNKTLDLQPEFQRGEVWSLPKRRRLIDSILRDWHVPPIHVIQNDKTDVLEVLDGQQRLAAIRDFVDGRFRVDGSLEPNDEEIESLDGLRYLDLPPKFRQRFDHFTIRQLRLVDYRPDEPGELFFRLNQPTSLTPAEQRNAFIGDVRTQIRELVAWANTKGMTADLLGFNNHRMSYDDVLARVSLLIERGSLAHKLTASDMANRYRQGDAFSAEVLDRVRAAITAFVEVPHPDGECPRFNKATWFSWMIFAVRMAKWFPDSMDTLAPFVWNFEEARKSADEVTDWGRRSALMVFNDRASSRVADVSSVQLRDLILWLFYSCEYRIHDTELREQLSQLAARLESTTPDPESAELLESTEQILLRSLEGHPFWGSL